MSKSFFGMAFLIVLTLSLQSFGAAEKAAKADRPKYASTGKNLAALNGMPIKVYLPAAPPADYVLFDFALEDESKTVETGHPNYSAMFLKDKSRWFQIESSDSVGDAEWDFATTTEAKSDIFGKFSVQWMSRIDPDENIKSPHVISSWLKLPQKAAAKNSASTRFYHLVGRGLSAEEAIDVVKKLKLQN